MLDPQDRVLFTEALRPPEGYQLSWAIGTTYTLDLVALIAAPLAFALFDWDEGEVQQTPDPIPLLEALRRYAGRMTVFVQAGRIAVPKPQQFLLSYLEDSIVEAAATTPGGLFHPKVWVLRFESEGEPTRYRFACMTRNLTFDRAWDTALILDGFLTERQTAIKRNRPLAEFVAALPALAVRPVSTVLRRRMRQTQQELLRVKWTLPERFRDVQFWPMGLAGRRRRPFGGRVDRMLVVSPFIGRAALDSLSEGGSGDVLVSRIEALQELEQETLDRFENVYVLDSAAEIDAHDSTESQTADNVLQGLHAKLYLADAGWQARLWTGSANATEAGLGPNVEFLVELTGTKPKTGIDALLASGSGEARFGDLLRLYVEHEYRPPDEVEEGLRARIEECRLVLSRAGLSANVAPSKEEGRFNLTIRSSKRLKLPTKVTVRCWPAMLAEGASARLAATGVLAVFEVALEELTSLFAFSVEATVGQRKRVERFALNLKLEGAPDDRRDVILRSILRNRNSVLRFLLFLLADGDGQQAAELLGLRQGAAPSGGGETPFTLELPLFESMLRALEREPTKLDHVARAIDDLRRTPEGEALLPEGFAEVWDPIWEAREALL